MAAVKRIDVQIIFDVENLPRYLVIRNRKTGATRKIDSIDMINYVKRHFVNQHGERHLRFVWMALSDASKNHLRITRDDLRQFATHRILVCLGPGGQKLDSTDVPLMEIMDDFIDEQTRHRAKQDRGVLVVVSSDMDFHRTLFDAARGGLQSHRVWCHGNTAPRILDERLGMNNHELCQLVESFNPDCDVRLLEEAASPQTAASGRVWQSPGHPGTNSYTSPPGGRAGSSVQHAAAGPAAHHAGHHQGRADTKPQSRLGGAAARTPSPLSGTGYCSPKVEVQYDSPPRANGSSSYAAQSSWSTHNTFPYRCPPPAAGRPSIHTKPSLGHFNPGNACLATQSSHTAYPPGVASLLAGTGPCHPAPPPVRPANTSSNQSDMEWSPLAAGSGYSSPPTTPRVRAATTTSSSSKLESSILKVHWNYVREDDVVVLSVRDGVEGPLLSAPKHTVQSWLTDIFEGRQGFITPRCYQSFGTVLYSKVEFSCPEAAAAALTVLNGEYVPFTSADGQVAKYQLYIKDPSRHVSDNQPQGGSSVATGAPPSWLSSTLKVQCRPFYCIHQGSSVTTASVENWLSELFADKRMDGFDSVHCQGSNGVFTHAWVNFHNPGAAAAARTAVRGQCLSLQSTSGQMVLWQLFVSFQRTGTGQANSSAAEMKPRHVGAVTPNRVWRRTTAVGLAASESVTESTSTGNEQSVANAAVGGTGSAATVPAAAEAAVAGPTAVLTSTAVLAAAAAAVAGPAAVSSSTSESLAAAVPGPTAVSATIAAVPSPLEHCAVPATVAAVESDANVAPAAASVPDPASPAAAMTNAVDDMNAQHVTKSGLADVDAGVIELQMGHADSAAAAASVTTTAVAVSAGGVLDVIEEAECVLPATAAESVTVQAAAAPAEAVAAVAIAVVASEDVSVTCSEALLELLSKATLQLDARRSLLPPTAASAMSNSPRTLFGLSTIGRAMEFLAVPGMHMQEAAAGIAQAVAAKAMLASAADQSWKLGGMHPLIPSAALATLYSSSRMLDLHSRPGAAIELFAVQPEADAHQGSDIEGDDDGCNIIHEARLGQSKKMRNLRDGLWVAASKKKTLKAALKAEFCVVDSSMQGSVTADEV